MEPLRQQAEFVHAHGALYGLQLAHAGRKASTLPPWVKGVGLLGELAGPEAGGWEDNVWGPSPIPFHDGLATPKECTKEYIKEVVEAFAASARRAEKLGADFVEIRMSNLMVCFVSA